MWQGQRHMRSDPPDLPRHFIGLLWICNFIERKNSMKKRLLSAILSASLLLTITACSDGTITGNPSGGNVSQDYSQGSSIASADMTASQIKAQARDFLDKSNISGADNFTVVKCDVNGGKWSVSAGNSVKFGDTYKWSGEDRNTCFNLYMADCIKDFKQGYVEIYLKDGMVSGVAAVPGGKASDIPSELQNEDAWSNLEVSWQSGKAGISKNGSVIGTSPKIAHKK